VASFGLQSARSGQSLITISLLSNANLETEVMTSDRFEDLSWHDNAIHAFRITEGDDGCSGNLILDIDYILEWIPPSAQAGNFSFVVSPADLVFLQVTYLVISIDYASSSSALQPMTIDEISREVVTYPNGYSEFAWKIELNWPEKSFISFRSPRMSQALRGASVRSTSQSLMPSQRAA
jgi:hypothetical protein